MLEGKIVQVEGPEDLDFAPADRWCVGFVGVRASHSALGPPRLGATDATDP